MKLQHIKAYISVSAMAVMTLITLLIAVMILQAIIMGTVSIFMPQYWYQRDEPELTEAQEQRWRINDMKKEFLVDGTIHLIHTTEEGPYRWDKERQIEVYDINNNLLWAGGQEHNPYTYLQWPDYRGGSQDLAAGYMAEMRMITPQLSQTLMIPVINFEREILQRWRYEPGTDYFIGFDSEGRKIGYAGSNGFKELQNEAKPFGELKYMTACQAEDSPSPQLLWHAENRLYKINFEKATVEAIVDLQDDIIERIALTNWAGIEPQKSEYHPQMHVLTEKSKHILLLKTPDQKLTINIPKEWRDDIGRGRDIRIVALNDKIYLQHYGTDMEPPPRDFRLVGKWREQERAKSRKMWIELHELGGGGNLKLVNRFEWIRPPLVERMASNEWDDMFSRVRNYVTMVSPPVYNITWLCLLRWSSAEYGFYRNWVQPYRNMAEIIQELQSAKMSWNWAIGGLLLCATFWHAWPRRITKAKLISWLILVALFNLAGFLTYLALNHTTVIRCAACGKKRGLQRPDCPTCKALLPTPERRETDLIFAGQSNS